jgi:hypothetical protein
VPGEGAYARIEREQPWILRGLPRDVTEPVEIEDRFSGGRLAELSRQEAGTLLADVAALEPDARMR